MSLPKYVSAVDMPLLLKECRLSGFRIFCTEMVTADEAHNWMFEIRVVDLEARTLAAYVPRSDGWVDVPMELTGSFEEALVLSAGYEAIEEQDVA